MIHLVLYSCNRLPVSSLDSHLVVCVRSFVQKLKNCAHSFTSFQAIKAAWGSSIILHIR